MYLPTDSERRRLVQQELTTRRHQRLQQVRAQSRQAAARVRQRCQAEVSRQRAVLKRQAVADWAHDKENQLCALEAEYAASISAVGSAHRAASSQPSQAQLQETLACSGAQQRRVDTRRHEAAVRRVREQRETAASQLLQQQLMRAAVGECERRRASEAAQRGAQRLAEAEHERRAAEQAATAATALAQTVEFQSAFRPALSFRPTDQLPSLSTVGSGSIVTPCSGGGKSPSKRVAKRRDGAGIGLRRSPLKPCQIRHDNMATTPTAAGSSTTPFSSSNVDVTHSQLALAPPLRRTLATRRLHTSVPSVVGSRDVLLSREHRPPPAGYCVTREMHDYDAREAAVRHDAAMQAAAQLLSRRREQLQRAQRRRGRHALSAAGVRADYERLVAALAAVDAARARQGGAGAADQHWTRRLDQIEEDATLLLSDVTAVGGDDEAEDSTASSHELVVPTLRLARQIESRRLSRRSATHETQTDGQVHAQRDGGPRQESTASLVETVDNGGVSVCNEESGDVGPEQVPGAVQDSTVRRVEPPSSPLASSLGADRRIDASDSDVLSLPRSSQLSSRTESSLRLTEDSSPYSAVIISSSGSDRGAFGVSSSLASADLSSPSSGARDHTGDGVLSRVGRSASVSTLRSSALSPSTGCHSTTRFSSVLEDVSSLRSGDLSSPSALSGGGGAGSTFDSTLTRYRRVPGEHRTPPMTSPAAVDARARRPSSATTSYRQLPARQCEDAGNASIVTSYGTVSSTTTTMASGSVGIQPAVVVTDGGGRTAVSLSLSADDSTGVSSMRDSELSSARECTAASLAHTSVLSPSRGVGSLSLDASPTAGHASSSLISQPWSDSSSCSSLLGVPSDRRAAHSAGTSTADRDRRLQAVLARVAQLQQRRRTLLHQLPSLAEHSSGGVAAWPGQHTAHSFRLLSAHSTMRSASSAAVSGAGLISPADTHGAVTGTRSHVESGGSMSSPGEAADSSVDTDVFEAGLRLPSTHAVHVQSTPLKPTSAAVASWRVPVLALSSSSTSNDSVT